MESENLWPKPAPLTEAQKQVKTFLESACSGDIELFNKLAKGLDNHGKGLAATVADVKDAKKRESLFFAAGEGKIELCKYLVENLKIDVNERDKEGETPVLNAARQGHTATVQYLIKKGADPAIHSTSGAALHKAAGNGHIELVKLFLSMGVDVDLQSDVGTPLMCAVNRSQEDAVKVLLEHHANFDAQIGDDNMCPLLAAVAANSFPCVELLVKAGAKVNVKVGEGMWCGEITPLLVAARKGNAETVKCLLQAGADPTVADQDGYMPIHLAATSDSRESVEALLTFTPQIQSVHEWTVDGVIEFMKSEKLRKQERTEAGRKANNGPTKNLPEVSPEAKKKAADAKAKGDEAFHRKDFALAKDAYTLYLLGLLNSSCIPNSNPSPAISSDPTDGTLFSKRSLCWSHLGKGEVALIDAKASKKLGQDLEKAYYGEGVALNLLQRFEEAANAFYRGIQIDPDNEELVTALKETVARRDAEAAKEFHDMELE